MRARHVVVVGFPGAESLDIVGPAEVFAGAQRLVEQTGRRDRGYRVTVACRGGGQIRTLSGLVLVADADLDALAGPVDTVVVAGGDGTRPGNVDPELAGSIRRIADRARRVASVCTGAFLLAEAGLLDGRRAVTHWAACAALARRYPQVHVDPDPIYVRDGNITTSAGVTSGMDLALSLVEEDLGREAALTIARWLVLFLRRPGNQSQFSAQLSAQLADRDALRDLQQWMTDHPAADLSVQAMATRAGMSPRNFARTFRQEAGLTPARYVERLRLEAARRRLEECDDTVDRIAATCGFGTAETMRRSFLRALGVGPAEYRRRFTTAATTAATGSST
ncbi:MAG TPA: DJ-1/PfpI family protein [Actinomycetes bacterium]|nr:DJ-1/PfpI family protein [Actinomycetes bacterium]